MTDRYFALTVTLDPVIREDDAQPIIEAIKMIKGVSTVKAHVADIGLYSAREAARRDLTNRLFKVLKEES